MAATVEPCEHEGVQAVCFTAVSGFAGDERGGDDLAVEAVISENTLEDEASTGGFVAGPHWGLSWRGGGTGVVPSSDR